MTIGLFLYKLDKVPWVSWLKDTEGCRKPLHASTQVATGDSTLALRFKGIAATVTKSVGVYNLAQLLDGLEGFFPLICDVLGWDKKGGGRSAGQDPGRGVEPATPYPV